MAMNSWTHTCTLKTLGQSSVFPVIGNFTTPGQCRPYRPLGELVRVKASTSDASKGLLSSSEGKNPLTLVLDVFPTIWRQTFQPISDFGFGRRSLWEGGVGLFVVSGMALFALTLAWLKGFQLRSRFRTYQTVFEFSQACGICIGTPVRIRGVTVGNVICVNSSLKCIEAVAEVEDEKIIIPRNSLVEVNQSGLLMETLIDITPRDPLPTPSVGPLDTDCIEERLIVCDKERIRGQQGVSLDELVGIFTRLGREADEIGIAKSYELAEKVAAVMQEAQPLLAKIEAIAEDVRPLLADVRSSSLLKNVASLTKSIAQTSEEFRNAQGSILRPENAEMMKKSIASLVFILKNVESISSNVSGFTGDEATRRNIKMLIKSLSRLL